MVSSQMWCWLGAWGIPRVHWASRQMTQTSKHGNTSLTGTCRGEGARATPAGSVSATERRWRQQARGTGGRSHRSPSSVVNHCSQSSAGMSCTARPSPWEVHMIKPVQWRGQHHTVAQQSMQRCLVHTLHQCEACGDLRQPVQYGAEG